MDAKPRKRRRFLKQGAALAGLVVGASVPASSQTAGVSAAPVPCLSPCIRDATVMAIHAPFATVVWDYINRAMPLGREGSLKPDDVYALILPKLQMPNRDGSAMPPEWEHGTPRLRGYP